MTKQKPQVGDRYFIYGYKQPVKVESVGDFIAMTNRKDLRLVKNKPSGEWISSKAGQASRRIRKA